jgi:hypothetical protein
MEPPSDSRVSPRQKAASRFPDGLIAGTDTGRTPKGVWQVHDDPPGVDTASLRKRRSL